MDNVRELLESWGYQINSSDSKGYRMAALYRGGNGKNSLLVDKNGNYWDFVLSQGGNIQQLAALTLGVSHEEAEKIVGEKSEVRVKPEEKIEQKRYFSPDILKQMLPSYGFYNKRGISTETLKEFQGGVLSFGKFHDRFLFPIFDKTKRIVGLAGRDLFNNNPNRPKWLLAGRKNSWCYPLNLSELYIKEKGQVILVEAIGELLALWEAGIKNVLVLFGLSISKEIIKNLLILNPSQIIIALNNDFDKEENRGLAGASKISQVLAGYFSDSSVIKVITPPNGRNDFGESTKEEILKWKEENNL